MIATFTALLFAHTLADYVFQTGWMVAHKRKPAVLLLHIALVLATAQAVLGTVFAPELLALAAAHLVIDALKLSLSKQDGLGAYLADQAAHLLTLAALAAYAPDLWARGLWAAQTYVAPALVLHLMVLAAGALLAVRAGGFAVGKLMARFDTPLPAEGLAEGGLMIGLLERGLIYLLLMTGQPGSIGFLIAAKSVMRFETASKEQKAAEYVIIGTLASFGWAIAITLGVIALRDGLPALEISAQRP